MSCENELPAGSVLLDLATTVNVGASTAPIKPVYSAAPPIEIELPDGRKIGMARPTMSLSAKVANVLADCPYKDPAIFEFEQKRVKMLLHINSIDGASEPKIENPIMRAYLEQRLGDENLDALIVAWAENFPQTDRSTLKIVKKP